MHVVSKKAVEVISIKRKEGVHSLLKCYMLKVTKGSGDGPVLVFKRTLQELTDKVSSSLLNISPVLVPHLDLRTAGRPDYCGLCGQSLPSLQQTGQVERPAEAFLSLQRDRSEEVRLLGRHSTVNDHWKLVNCTLSA